MGLCQLAAKHRASDLDAACAKAMDATARLPAFREIKNLLAAGDQAPSQLHIALREVDPIIRPLDAYADFIRRKAPGGANLFHPEPKPLAALPTAISLTSPAITPASLTEPPIASKAS
jgi:hypothetical protein